MPSRPPDPNASEPALEEIAAFLAVVERKSFGAAGRHLEVATSTISRRVAALEAKLGARLLQRTSRKLTMTELGERYYERAAAALSDLEEAAAAVRELQSDPRGHLRITAPIDVGESIGQLITAFGRAYPEVSVSIELTQRTVDLVGEGFDLAIRAGRLRDSSLIARKLDDSIPVLVASPGYLKVHPAPRRPDELARHQFALFHRYELRRGVGRLVLHGRRGAREVQVRAALVSDDFGFLRDAAVADAGIAVIPNVLIAGALRRGELSRVLPSWHLETSPIHLVYPSRVHVPAKTRAFCDFAIAWMAPRASSS
ncbi:MAG: LysR family transcriptional regulator [Nannocystaceae bacterium]